MDWIGVCPKAGSELVQTSGDELKLVWPQSGSDVARLAALDFQHLLVQPLDDANAGAHVQACIDLVMTEPRWRLPLQTHRHLGLRWTLYALLAGVVLGVRLLCDRHIASSGGFGGL